MLREIGLNKENCYKNEAFHTANHKFQSNKLVEDVKAQYQKMKGRFDQMRRLGFIENFPLLKIAKLNEMSSNELLTIYDELLQQDTNLQKNYSKLLHNSKKSIKNTELKINQVDYSVLKNIWEKRAGKAQLDVQQNIDRLNKNIASIKSSIITITQQQYDIMGIDIEHGYKTCGKGSLNSFPFILSEFILHSKQYIQLQQENDTLKTAIRKYKDLQVKLQKSYDTIQRLKEEIKMERERYSALQDENAQLNEKNTILEENQVNLCSKMAEITQQNIRKNIQLMQLSRKQSIIMNNSTCSVRNMSISFEELSKMSIIPRESLPLDLQGVDLTESQYLPENIHQEKESDKNDNRTEIEAKEDKDRQMLHSFTSQHQTNQGEILINSTNRKKNIKFMRKTRMR